MRICLHVFDIGAIKWYHNSGTLPLVPSLAAVWLEDEAHGGSVHFEN